MVPALVQVGSSAPSFHKDLDVSEIETAKARIGLCHQATGKLVVEVFRWYDSATKMSCR
jgi:hypothetical protein